MEHEEILDFWFGTLDAEGTADPEHRARWWKKEPAFDKLILDRFGAVYDALRAGEHKSWEQQAPSALAAIVVLDQFPRNMFRGTERMFESDALALERSINLIEEGLDKALRTDEKVFAYMPMMHAEDLGAQERCIEQFAKLASELKGKSRERIEGNLKFAKQHRDIVRDWGRFPHRNALLGRSSTQEELAFLQTKGSSF